MQNRHVAVILAGGVGERSGFSRPKQFVKLAGKPILAHTVQAFQSHELIDEIAIVANSNSVHEVEDIVGSFQFSKVRRILVGGRERYESSLSAIRAYEKDALQSNLRLIFHDAVRPLITERIITDVVRALDFYNAVDVAIPSSDTVVEANLETNTISDIPARQKMRLGQTPQAFAYGTIKEAYSRAILDPKIAATDDCGIVLKYAPSERIYLVDGAATNIKLTYGTDLLLLDKLMQCNVSKRVNAISETILLSGLKNKNLVIFGGTSGIGREIAKLARAYDARVHIAGRSTGLNISNATEVDAFLKRSTQADGPIDVIINTAAVLHRQPLVHMAPEDVTDGIRTNIVGAFNIARAAHEYLFQSKGHLLMFASSSYTYGRANYSVYSASKAAVVNLTQALADEWAGDGIKVNCINPERTQTEMRLRAFGAEPEGTLLDPAAVARRALSVVSTQSSGYVYDITRT